MQRGQFDELSSQIISAAIEVHKALGPGLLESAYEQCLCRELELRGVPFVQQQQVPVEYKGVRLDCGYRLDLCVAGRIVVEVKSVSELLPIHEAQLLTYLRLTDFSLGLMLNFNVPLMKDGIRRIVHNFKSDST
ncbi:MAG TPA: GxxExxY protein [Caulifigura sp.]|jgi:GxxExxY protein|nr:GxxExxY protein [Caulifigura sp.]